MRRRHECMRHWASKAMALTGAIVVFQCERTTKPERLCKLMVFKVLVAFTELDLFEGGQFASLAHSLVSRLEGQEY
jgi:hypothetical protein